MQEWLLAACWQRERQMCRLRHGIGSCTLVELCLPTPGADPQKDVCAVPHDVVGEEAAEYYTPERLATTGPLPLGKRRDLMFFNGRLFTHTL